MREIRRRGGMGAGSGVGRRLGAVLAVMCVVLPRVGAQLVPDFYAQSCPDAERIIREQMQRAIQLNPRIAAKLLRLHFHDCFVQGCDGSVLLDAVDGEPAEKDADINATLGGFELVDAIKAALETACPGTVSCADLLALASKAAVFLTGGPDIPVLTGRRDALTSFAGATMALPTFTNVNGLIDTFKQVGLNLVDMIALSGGHTIGIGHCTNVQQRIPPFPSDHLIVDSFRSNLSAACRVGRKFAPSNVVDMDFRSPNTFDNTYFQNLVEGKGLFVTDSLLHADGRTRARVKAWAVNQAAFFQQFSLSMLKMSTIGVLTGGQGEVRFSCNFTNQY